MIHWGLSMMKTNGKAIKSVAEITFPVLVVLSYMILCGFLFEKTTVELDTEKYPVYRNESADTVIQAFTDSEKTARENYNGKNLLLYGKIVDKGKNNNEFSIGNSAYKKNIKCKISDKSLIEVMSGLNINDSVRVYGKFNVPIIGGMELKAVKIEKSSLDRSTDNVYSLLNGRSLDKNTAKKRIIGKDKVSFFIPSNWEAVEHSIIDEDLGKIPGYQYRLNELGKKEALAESFFVCYFDKKEFLADSDDMNKNDLIEKAILRDIFKKDDIALKKYPAKKVKTPYGASYKYYKDVYTKEISDDNYKAEVVFQEKGEDGIIIYVYIYENHKRYTDDIMLVLSTIDF